MNEEECEELLKETGPIKIDTPKMVEIGVKEEFIDVAVSGYQPRTLEILEVAKSGLSLEGFVFDGATATLKDIMKVLRVVRDEHNQKIEAAKPGDELYDYKPHKEVFYSYTVVHDNKADSLIGEGTDNRLKALLPGYMAPDHISGKVACWKHLSCMRKEIIVFPLTGDKYGVKPNKKNPNVDGLTCKGVEKFLQNFCIENTLHESFIPSEEDIKRMKACPRGLQLYNIYPKKENSKGSYKKWMMENFAHERYRKVKDQGLVTAPWEVICKELKPICHASGSEMGTWKKYYQLDVSPEVAADIRTMFGNGVYFTDL